MFHSLLYPLTDITDIISIMYYIYTSRVLISVLLSVYPNYWISWAFPIIGQFRMKMLELKIKLTITFFSSDGHVYWKV